MPDMKNLIFSSDVVDALLTVLPLVPENEAEIGSRDAFADKTEAAFGRKPPEPDVLVELALDLHDEAENMRPESARAALSAAGKWAIAAVDYRAFVDGETKESFAARVSGLLREAEARTAIKNDDFIEPEI